MAEKRAARSRRRTQRPDLSHLPPPPKPAAAAATVATEQPDAAASSATTATTTTTTDQVPSNNDDNEVTTKAQQLLATQRESVAMLTLVKEAIDRIPMDALKASLSQQGYWYGDDILGDDNNNNILDQLQAEGQRLYEDGKMTSDVNQLGAGEFVVSLQGGDAQYHDCPRSIEFVVSTTKHLPERLNTANNNNINLSSGNCMATMRTFDRKSFQASLELLAGNTTAIEDIPLDSRSLEAIVSDKATDIRRLSLCYFLVPSTWDESCGAGLSFLDDQTAGNEESSSTTTTIVAKRDRLVVWDSSETKVRKQTWKGSQDIPIASCIELHLVESQD